MRSSILAILICISLVSMCFCSAEEQVKTSMGYYSSLGNRTLEMMEKTIELPAGTHKIGEIEETITKRFALYFRHSFRSMTFVDSGAEFDNPYKDTLRNLLKHILSPIGLIAVVEYDGTILVLLEREAETYQVGDEKNGFNGAPPTTDAGWRVKLAWALNGRVTFGEEDLGKPITSIPWRFRYCPLLSAEYPLDELLIDKHYIHLPLRDILDTILTKNGLRAIPWGGVMLVLGATEPPGPEPAPFDRSIVRTKGIRADKFEEWLATEIDTSLTSPRRTIRLDIEKALNYSGRRTHLHASAIEEMYKSLPCGVVEIARLLALLKHFDEIDSVAGDDWLLLFKGKEPEDKIAELNFKPLEVFKIGEVIPEGEILETPPFEQMSTEAIEKLRLMSVEERLDRKIKVVFRRISLAAAFERLALRAYFHFEWDKSLNKMMEEYYIEGYCEDIEVREILLMLCIGAKLSWSVKGKEPFPGDLDTRFVVRIYKIDQAGR